MIDNILSDLGEEFSDNDPLVEELFILSDEADEYYRERHIEGYTDIEINLEVQLYVKIIRMAQERKQCTNEFLVNCLEVFVNQMGGQ